MTVTAQRGEFYFAPKAAKEGTPSTWYRHRALSIGFGVVDDNRQAPLEVGGTSFPTGAYKAGAYVAGGVQLAPRLEDVFGWLLYAALGSSATDSDDPESGINKHKFAPHSTDDTQLPWLDIAKYIPGTNGVITKGSDAKVAGLEITIPQTGTMVASPTFVGRVPSWIDDESAITSFRSAAAAMESYDSVPLACKGLIKVGFDDVAKTVADLLADSGGTYDVPSLGSTISIMNNLTTPQEEMIQGSYNPDDFAVRSRIITVRFTYKWADPALYLRILTGEADGTAWSPIPTYAPVLIEAESPDDISGMSNPYTFRFMAERVHWAMDGPPQLAAGQMIAQTYVGTVQIVSGQEYARCEIENEVASYAWPT